jgi:hypothetical protein
MRLFVAQPFLSERTRSLQESIELGFPENSVVVLVVTDCFVGIEDTFRPPTAQLGRCASCSNLMCTYLHKTNR